MIDSNTQKIINTNIFPEETYRQHLETFIIYSMKDLSIYNDPNTPNPLSPLSLLDLEKHVLTGDGLREYPTIAAKANIDFHRCIFHLLMGQRIPVWKRQAIILRKIAANNLKMEKNDEYNANYYKEYAGKNKKFGNRDQKRRKKLNKVEENKRENRKLQAKNRKLQKEYDENEDYNKRISKIFVQDTIKDAKRKFNILYNQINFLPDEIARFLRNLKKDLDNTLFYIENENIPKTNNWLELFFYIVFPKRLRNRFKTDRGVERFLRAGIIRWYENVVLKEKVEVNLVNSWSKIDDTEFLNSIIELITGE